MAGPLRVVRFTPKARPSADVERLMQKLAVIERLRPPDSKEPLELFLSLADKMIALLERRNRWSSTQGS